MINPFDPGYYEEGELRGFGFKAVGRHVRIAKSCTIIGLNNIEIGDHVRIDGYCTLIASGEGRVRLGSYIHIAGYCGLYAGHGLTMADFSGLSRGVSIYTGSDDYSGHYLTNPTVPARYTGVKAGAVSLGRHVIVGTGTVLLPRVEIGEGSAVGAMSLVSKALESWGVYSGCPARRIKARVKDLLKLEAEFLATDAQELVRCD